MKTTCVYFILLLLLVKWQACKGQTTAAAAAKNNIGSDTAANNKQLADSLLARIDSINAELRALNTGKSEGDMWQKKAALRNERMQDSLFLKNLNVEVLAFADTIINNPAIDTSNDSKGAAEKKQALMHKPKEPETYSNNVQVISQLQGKQVYRVKFKGNIYDYVVVDLTRSNIKLHWLDKKDRKYNTIQAVMNDTTAVKTKTVELITNAGMYTTESAPQGLYIENGKTMRPLDIDSSKFNNGDNFQLKPNGVFFIDSNGGNIGTSEFFARNVKHKVQYATQSGPMLVISDKIHPAFREGSQNLNIRSGVGIINQQKIVFAISVTATNFYDFAQLFKQHLNCSEALYLDGAISKMYIPALREEDTGGHFGPIISVTKK